MGAIYELRCLEAGNLQGSSREVMHGMNAHNMSSSSLGKQSDLQSRLRIGFLRQFLINLQKVLLGTKLSILFPAIPLAVIARYQHFGRV